MYEEHYYEPVVGVTFEGRQQVVAKLSEGERLILRREPHNRFHPNALMVLRENGQQVGYLRRELADTIVPEMRMMDLDRIEAREVSLTGGYYPGVHRGVRILFSLPIAQTMEV